MNEPDSTRRRLSDAEELVLLRESQSNDTAVRDRAVKTLIAAYEGYLYKKVVGFCPANREALDALTSAGMRGLANAVAKYYLGSGTRFLVFASKHIDGEMRQQLREDRNLIRRPRSAKEDVRRVNEARARLHQAGYANPTVDEIVNELTTTGRISRKRVAKALEADGKVIAIDGLLPGDRRARSGEIPGGVPTPVDELLCQEEERRRKEARDRGEEDDEWNFTLEDIGFVNSQVARLVAEALRNANELGRRERLECAVRAADRCYRRRDLFAAGARGKFDASTIQILSVPVEGPDAYSRRAWWKMRSSW